MLEQRCRELGVPSLHVLEPIMKVFESYLGAPQTPIVAGQHVLDADYFRRIDALNFTMAHDDGHLPGDLNEADIIILGISRTSKTPTSIYLAQRGYKTANVPLVPGIEPPAALTEPHKAFIVGLIASPERIAEIRRNRVRLMADRNLDDYVDRTQIADEIAYSRRLCARHGWPVIDVTRRSIEETAATIIKLLHDRETAATTTGLTRHAVAERCGTDAHPRLGQPLASAACWRRPGSPSTSCRPIVDERAIRETLVRRRHPGGSRRRRRGSGPRQGRDCEPDLSRRRLSSVPIRCWRWATRFSRSLPTSMAPARISRSSAAARISFTPRWCWRKRARSRGRMSILPA